MGFRVSGLGLLGGSWVVISGVTSRVTIITLLVPSQYDKPYKPYSLLESPSGYRNYKGPKTRVLNPLTLHPKPWFRV